MSESGSDNLPAGSPARRTPIRLAFFVDSMEVGGSELNAIRTLERLDRSRFELEVFHTGSEGPLLARYQRLGIPLHHVRISGFLRPDALSAGWRLTRTLRARRIEILHSHDIYSNILAVPWARLARVPVVIASRRWQGAVPSRSHAWANRVVSRWADAVLANSSSVAGAVLADGVAAAAVRVLPNFVSPDGFAPYPETLRERLFSKWGIPAGALVVGIVARLSPVKDHATLLEAIRPLLAERPELHLLIVGEGPLRSSLEEQAQGLASSRIHFAGRQPPTPNPHGLLDISVLSSRTEGFPNAIIEAMAAGKPVVATAVGGTVDAVRPPETGLLVPPGDPAAFARALLELLDAPSRRVAMGQAARRIAREEYAEEKVLGRLSDWYEALLRRRHQQMP